MAKKQKKLATRQTVKTKYHYKQVDPTAPRVRVTTGYGVEAEHKKLAFKSGKLTKAGEEFRQSILDNPDMSAAEKSITTKEFDKYVASRNADNLKVTASSFQSHMIGVEYDRMLYNMNIDKNELVKALAEKYMSEAGYDYNSEPDDKEEKAKWKEAKNEADKQALEVANDWDRVSAEIEFDYDTGWRLK